MSDELEYYAKRVLSRDEATKLIGTDVGTDLEPSFKSPRPGQTRHIYDLDTGELIGIVTRLDPARLAGLRATVKSIRYGQNVARQGRDMNVRGVVFGYSPKKPIARQEGCRQSAMSRDRPDVSAVLEDIAGELGRQFRELYPARAEADAAVVKGAVLDDWRMHEDSLWTSGVINQSTVLPYHRDGNNFDTWSAMPTVRYGMDGGRLHVPEYDLVFPCGDGDVTWFFGKDLVHGVTPIRARAGREDPYRYSVVFYSIQGMKNCRTFAEETRNAARARTARERAAAEAIRAERGLSLETDPGGPEIGVSEVLDLETGELA